jgi:hypothetical protein
MSLRDSDYEERVLHFLLSLVEIKIFTIRQLSRATNIKDGTARSIISRFEDLELVKRVMVSPEEAWRFNPSKGALRLKKVKRLAARAALINRLRAEEIERESKYQSTR